MQKISLTIDLNKLDKTRIQERTYTNKDGAEVTAREYKFDVVEMKPENKKTIKEGDTWAMVKAFFVCDTPTKEERESKTNTKIVGEGIVFENKGVDSNGMISPNDSSAIPF